jgi:hypothetical protein
MATASAFIGMTKVGESTFFSDRWKCNYAMVCPQCGELWGRIFITTEWRWYPLSVSCDRCGPSRFLDYAGSLLVWNEPEMMKAFDSNFWDREVRLHFAYDEWATNNARIIQSKWSD